MKIRSDVTDADKNTVLCVCLAVDCNFFDKNKK